MNLSAAVMLFEENGVRPCKVEYDPDNGFNNKGAQHTHFFKCVDASVKKDDLVIVQTSTRHGFTVAKVTQIGYTEVPVDFDGATSWLWVAAKFDNEAFKAVLNSEKELTGRVSEAHANKMRNDLKSAMGLGQVSLKDVFIKAPAAIASPHGQPAAAEVPEYIARANEEQLAKVPPPSTRGSDDVDF